MTTGHKRVSNAGRKEDSNENPLFAEMVAASRVLANLAPRSVGLDIGATWLVDGARATIEHQPSVHEVVVRYAETGKVETVAISRLKPLVLEQGSPEAGGLDRAIETYPADTWQRAVEQEQRVKAWLEAGDLSPATRGDVAKALNLSDRQLRRKIEKYLTLRTLVAFLPEKGGTPKGSTQLDPALEAMMRNEPPRVSRRLQPLRRWSHEQVEQVLT